MATDPIGDRIATLKDLVDGIPVSIADDDVAVPAYTVLPARITPPFFYVFADFPYVTPEDATYGTVTLKLVVGFIPRPGDNEAEVAQANQALFGIYQRLTRPESPLTAGDASVGRISLNGNDFFGATVYAATDISLEEA